MGSKISEKSQDLAIIMFKWDWYLYINSWNLLTVLTDSICPKYLGNLISVYDYTGNNPIYYRVECVLDLTVNISPFQK